jgi:hypothetical protein
MEGLITTISSSSVTINVDTIGGSGSYNVWNFSITGNPGTAGATGATGSTGATGATGSSGTGYQDILMLGGM